MAVLIRRELRPGEIERWLPRERRQGLILGVGRAAEGLHGFCETHRLASEALQVAERRGLRMALHADVELDALLLRDPAFARSLISNYIVPLDATLLQTLQACYVKGWNESAVARALDLNRKTVGQRLDRVQQLIGRPLSACRFNLELALRALELQQHEQDKAV